MKVAVDEPRDHDVACQVDHWYGARCRMSVDLLESTHCRDLSIENENRPRIVTAFVSLEREDRAVAQDEGSVGSHDARPQGGGSRSERSGLSSKRPV